MDYEFSPEEMSLVEKEELQISPDKDVSLIRHLTQREPIEKIVTREDLKKFATRMMFSGKDKSTAFIKNPKMVQLNTRMRLNLSLMESLGLTNLAWDEIWSNIDLMALSQGQDGNMVRALITKVHEYRTKTDEEKKQKTWERLFGKKKEEQNVMKI